MRGVFLLVSFMLVSGIANSLLMKAQDKVCVRNCDDPDPRAHVEYAQPVWQTLIMFLGESLCLIPVLARALHQKIVSSRSVSLPEDEDQAPPPTPALEAGDPLEGPKQVPLLHGRSMVRFFFPAMCDIIGTTLMNVGLILTPVSIYQMTRGALVLWVGLFSVLFLRRHLLLFQWLCLALVMVGVGIVGLSGSLPPPAPQMVILEGEELPELARSLLGVLLILFAQIFTATQFVIEEKIMEQYTVEPLVAVGSEGVFGASTLIITLVLAHVFYGSTPAGRGGKFDIQTGWEELAHTPARWYAVAIAISIALFNFFGLNITNVLSAAARSTIDTCRTLGIWIVSLLLGWEHLYLVQGSLQAIGFACLVTGTMIFNGIWKPPKFLRPTPPRRPRHHRARSRSRSRSRSRARTESAAEPSSA